MKNSIVVKISGIKWDRDEDSLDALKEDGEELVTEYTLRFSRWDWDEATFQRLQDDEDFLVDVINDDIEERSGYCAQDFSYTVEMTE